MAFSKDLNKKYIFEDQKIQILEYLCVLILAPPSTLQELEEHERAMWALILD